MCRNIKILFNFDPPVTDEEVRAASLQFVRKITGFSKPSKANEAAFLAAVDEIAGCLGSSSSGARYERAAEEPRRRSRQGEKLAPQRDSALEGSSSNLRTPLKQRHVHLTMICHPERSRNFTK